MTLSKGAVGNLINRYRAVLRKCRMMNVFGSLAVAGMLGAGSAGLAGAEELSGDISPISLSGSSQNIIGVEDISLQSSDSRLRHLINVSGQGQLVISMSDGKAMTVGNADGVYLKDFSNYDEYTSAFHVAGSGSSASFAGTGTFSMTGGGKLLGVCAFLSENGGTLTLSGNITGEAQAVMNGTAGYASFVAAAARGNLVFEGDKTVLRAKAATGNSANGAFVKYGGMIDFASKSVLIESKTDSNSVGINCADGTVKTGSDTDLDIVVEGSRSITGIQLTASSSDIQIAGNLDVTAVQTGQNSSASIFGVFNDSGKLAVSGPTSLQLTANASPNAKGLSASGKADTKLEGDVKISVTGSPSGSALYTVNSYDSFTQTGICPAISLGAEGKDVTLESSGYAINNQGGNVSLTGRKINIKGSTGVYVSGGGNENVFADVRFNGPTTIDAEQAILMHIGFGQNVGASVTFAYNPTPINVPVTKESADSKVNGSVTGSFGTINKENAGSLAFYGDISAFGGTFNQKSGTTFLSEGATGYFSKAQVNVTGGTLVAPSLSFQGKGKLTLAGGTLETGTGQIFTNGLNAEGDNKDPGAVKLSGDNWSFDSGLIAFNDANYNLAYAQAAAGLLDASNVEAGGGAGSTSAKEITFTGAGYVDPTPPPVDPDPDPVPPVDPDPVPSEPEPDHDRTGTVSVDELNNNNANNIVLGNVTITTTGTGSDSGKDFVVGADVKDDTTASIAGSIGGKNLDLGSSGRDILVVGGRYLTLVGGSSADTQLVMTGKEDSHPVNVRVGKTDEGQSGVLNLGTPVMDSGGKLSGNVQIADGSAVNVRAGTHVITGETNETTGMTDVAGVNNNGGTLTVAEGAHLQSTLRQTGGQTNVSGRLTSESVELSGGGLNVSGSVDSSSLTASKGDITVAGTLAAKVLTASSDVRISVGDQGNAGRMIAHQTQLQGGSVFLDPAWKGNDALADASHGVFTFVDNKIDGLLTAGQNSLLVLGEANTDWALDAFGRSGLRWGQDGVTAALSIQKPQTLDSSLGAVMVDGSKTSAPTLTQNTATFASGSLLLVDGKGLNGAAALTSQGGTLSVDAGAKLLMDNLTQGEYTITSGFSNSDVQGWNGDNLSTPDNLIGLALSKAADGSMKIQAKAQRSSDVFRGLSLVSTMDAIWGKGLNDTGSDNMGIRFLSRAANETYLSKADTVRVVDGAAQIAVAGGVQGMAVAVADAPVRAIQDHASLSHMTVTREGSVRKDGLDLWINALYGAQHARGFGAGALDGGYNADFGGIVFGGDYAFGDFRVGMALNAGSGTARSRGDFNATKNDFDFWGVNLYGSWSRDQFNIVADLGYSGNKNEVKQDLPATMRLGQLRADVDTGVLTAGLRGECRFETDWADVTPHVGVRYYNLRTDGFASRIDDHDVFRVGRDTQEIWTFPIGVSLSRDFETASGWKAKPRADLSVVPAAGDLKVRTKAGVPGVAASDTVKARMMDSVSFDGTLGLEVRKDNVSFGLDYGIRASEHKTDHGVNLSFTYKF